MTKLSFDDEVRVAALRSLGLLDTEPETDFDSVTDLAVTLTGASMAAVSLVDRDRQWFKSNIGLPAPETPRNIAFCDHAIRQDGIFYIPDTHADERFKGNVLVTGEPFIRSYAGVPISDPAGHKLGTLCVIDVQPMALDNGTVERLKTLARMTENIIAMRLKTTQLDASIRRHDLAIAGSAVGIWELDPVSGTLFASSRLMDLIGRREGDPDHGPLIIQNGTDEFVARVAPSEQSRVRKALDNHLINRTPFELSFPMTHSHGRELIVAVRGQAQWGEDDRAIKMAGSLEDVTEKTRLERERRKAADILETVTELSGIGSWALDLAEEKLFWDQTTRKIHEVDEEFEPNLETAIGFYAPEARPVMSEALEKGIETGQPWDLELPLITATGRRTWVRARGRPIYNDTGEMTRLLGSFADISERKKREDELRSLTLSLNLALDVSGIGMWKHQPDSRVFVLDERSCQLFGLEPGDSGVLFDEWRSRIHPDDLDHVVQAGRDAADGQDDYRCEYRIHHPEDGIRHVRAIGRFHEAEDGTLWMTGMNQDITEDVRRSQELERRRADAEAASIAKSQFLANMSHEIRTPLHGVLGMAQLLETTPLDSTQKFYTETIRTSGRALQDLIEDILDISKIETGVLELKPAPFNLASLIDNVADIVAGPAKVKQLRLDRIVSGDLPASVIGDEKRIRQILVNLAGNAVKFTDSGSVSISAEKGAGEAIRFTVSDTGPGIPQNQQAAIFDRFAQIDASSTRRHGGAGLGLAICRELISLAGGELGLNSQVGKGSEFWVEIPLPPAFAPNEKPEDATHNIGDLVLSASILVVDDDPTNQRVAAALLERAGCRVDLAGDGKAAIDRLRQAEFDAVLMDMQMPVMSGEEAIDQLRNGAIEQTDIPVIALTANATPEARELCLAVGADAYLSKPLQLDDLLQTLKACIEGRESGRFRKG